ncbi:acyltransferase family protein [Agromyces sp. CCNWLW203]|uniref:acyltransferase family protein n=1 Tax=Agromyces sp. CCNWLW203 TaxID=3112842 RepID=UPI002F966763
MIERHENEQTASESVDRPVPTPVAPRRRDTSVDVLKGIGIVLIILGHLDASGIGGSFIAYLYTFHVALFFVAAGYTWRAKPGLSFGSVVVTKFRTIYVPYIVFFIISLAYGHLVMRFVFGQPVAPFDPVQSLKALLASSEWLNTVPTYNFALWFLPVFFVASVLFDLLQKVRNVLAYVVVVIALAAVSIPIQDLLPGRPVIAINVVPVALVFMATGYLIRRYIPIARISYFVAIPVLVFSLWAAFMFPGNVARIGSYWYFPGAIASIVLYLRFSIDIRSSSFLQFVGRNSLIVFGIHGLVASTYPFTHIQDALAPQWNGLMLYLVNAAYVLLVSVVIVKGYRLVRVRFDRSLVSWRSRRAAVRSA